MHSNNRVLYQAVPRVEAMDYETSKYRFTKQRCKQKSDSRIHSKQKNLTEISVTVVEVFVLSYAKLPVLQGSSPNSNGLFMRE